MPNAIEMLREDHRKVKDLFEHFEGTDSGDKKRDCRHRTARA